MYIGLADLYVAKLDTDTLEYSDGCLLGHGMEVKIKPKYAEGKIYADGQLVKHRKRLLYAKLTVETTSIPSDAAAVLFDHETEAYDGTVTHYVAEEGRWVGIGLRSTEDDGEEAQNAVLWLLKAKFDDPDQEFETEGDRVNFKTPELSGVAVPLEDGSWRLTDSFEDEEDAVTWLKVQAGIMSYVMGLDEQALNSVVYFTFDSDGNLILNYYEDSPLDFSVSDGDDGGELLYVYSTDEEPDMYIDDDGDLIYETED